MAEKKIPALLVEDNKFCPGCGHGIINRVLAEVLEEMELADMAVGSLAVGCACLMMDTFGVDWVQAPHGRAAAVACGVKRVRPENFVFTYQGDGDSLAIGFSETMYAAIRNENITAIIVNNGIFGMTGGQMAPTTMIGQKTTTCPGGRCAEREGSPLKMTEIIGPLAGVAFAARTAVNSVKNINKTKKAIRRAFEVQENGQGFGFVEVLATCPTNWKMTPLTANQRVADELIPYFPLGTVKDIDSEGGK